MITRHAYGATAKCLTSIETINNDIQKTTNNKTEAKNKNKCEGCHAYSIPFYVSIKKQKTAPMERFFVNITKSDYEQVPVARLHVTAVLPLGTADEKVKAVAATLPVDNNALPFVLAPYNKVDGDNTGHTAV